MLEEQFIQKCREVDPTESDGIFPGIIEWDPFWDWVINKNANLYGNVQGFLLSALFGLVWVDHIMTPVFAKVLTRRDGLFAGMACMAYYC